MTQHDTDIDSNRTHHDSDMTSPVVRATVEEAAKLLGVSVDAVRKRIERGTLDSEKIDGTRFVFVNTRVMTHQDRDMTTHQDPDMSALVSSMQDQIDTLKRELEDRKEEARRKDVLLMNMTEAMKAITPGSSDTSPEPRESPETASEDVGKATTPEETQEASQRRSWLYRFFFGP